jgi:uncharacterized RDD family membrane protein YckC
MKLGDLSSWAILIIVICLLNPAIFAILDFLEVDRSSYDSYIIWGNALLIFWFVLSENRTSELSKI